ncbi:sigma-54-dependent transcriptional regulator [Desulfohalovibrio reitneri]|uniref:sigma-54-dependent transcriptional regulator n=1 Tax=Desulfohalovibrio reitneri TaxID=1307759 RepID=UPI0004A763C8|nr:sigma-54 dependent transcriptional regulator [Desulfohalovibrio reitneri]
MTGRVLIVDDEKPQRMMLRAVLEDAGWEVAEADGGKAALEKVAEVEPEAVLLDMRMPDMEGSEVLERLLADRPGLPVIMLTAYGTVGSAVEAMKRGAFDYLSKPADNDELVAVLDKAREWGRLHRENRELKQRLTAGPDMVGQSAPMRRLAELIEQVGPSEATVLIQGESGTGKELVAERLHTASQRADGPLIKVNCAALPHELLESELFGYEKGAFTGANKAKPGRFQLAHGGTIFLDEVGELDTGLQAKLLRVLQERTVEPLGSTRQVKVDVRIIAATNRDLEAEAQKGNFREDLYYRLAVLVVRIPPLRERMEDLPLLAAHLLRKLGEKNRKDVRDVSPAFLEALRGHDWPGNVRELENVLERALVLARADSLTPDLLPPQLRAGGGDAAAGGESAAEGAQEEGISLDQAEKSALEDALRRHGGHRQKTADALGISRRTLQYKLKKYGLTSR